MLNTIIAILGVLWKKLIFKILSWGPKMIFEKWIYSDKEMRNHIEILLIQIDVIGNNILRAQYKIINLSPYYDINIKVQSARVISFKLSPLIDKEIVVRRSGISESMFVEREINGGEKQVLYESSKRRDCVNFTISIRASFSNRFIEKSFEVTNIIVRCLNATT